MFISADVLAAGELRAGQVSLARLRSSCFELSMDAQNKITVIPFACLQCANSAGRNVDEGRRLL